MKKKFNSGKNHSIEEFTKILPSKNKKTRNKKRNIKFIEDEHTSLVKIEEEKNTSKNNSETKVKFKKWSKITLEDFAPKNENLKDHKSKFNKTNNKEDLSKKFKLKFNESNPEKETDINGAKDHTIENNEQKGENSPFNDDKKENILILNSNTRERHQMDENRKKLNQNDSESKNDENSTDNFEKRKETGKNLKDRASQKDITINNSNISDDKQKSSKTPDKIDQLIRENQELEKASDISKKEIIDRKSDEKTPFDYLVEEAQLEQQKMLQVEDYENQKTNVERDRAFHRMRMTEGMPFDEIQQTDPFQGISDSIFETKIENDIKMYICPNKECGKSFPSLSRVKRHYVVHTGQKPFKCLNKNCRKTFSRKDNMLQHFRNHCFLSRKTKFREFDP
ncbi:Zn-finger [Pseudoloma neurophilia]|uniref:Zn-finger n=1 Tax=Pseudoloma neurophilia TaxID=146866 RepID=A0A0R0LV40_9MICR|nr:Zn-finger [Pseudoloma neurophilia]